MALLDKMQRSAPLLISLAETQAALGRPQDSEKVYREILGKDPSDVAACNNLSLILALQKTKLDEALALVNKAIEGYGPQGAFLDTRAVIWIARHEPRRAIEDLMRPWPRKRRRCACSTRPGPITKTETPVRPGNFCKRPTTPIKRP